MVIRKNQPVVFQSFNIIQIDKVETRQAKKIGRPKVLGKMTEVSADRMSLFVGQKNLYVRSVRFYVEHWYGRAEPDSVLA